MSIEKYLPHRDPIRLIDKIISHDEASIICQVDWPKKKFFHNNSHTAMIEMIAQASAVMMAYKKTGQDGLGMLTAIKNFNFIATPNPSDNLTVEITVEGGLGQHKIVNGTVYQQQKSLVKGRVFLYLETKHSEKQNE
ncbi:hypothetical protein [Candidatus Uabimicrobium sp. HlEnr_7]|uniref:hypothetical protein n=1 Tax=Candidatus Uabimicrobium helgolandensis TaxID=3095367 RepID=UPI003555EA9E